LKLSTSVAATSALSFSHRPVPEAGNNIDISSATAVEVEL
jgi:hypothetical protein